MVVVEQNKCARDGKGNRKIGNRKSGKWKRSRAPKPMTALDNWNWWNDKRGGFFCQIDCASSSTEAWCCFNCYLFSKVQWQWSTQWGSTSAKLRLLPHWLTGDATFQLGNKFKLAGDLSCTVMVWLRETASTDEHSSSNCRWWWWWWRFSCSQLVNDKWSTLSADLRCMYECCVVYVCLCALLTCKWHSHYISRWFTSFIYNCVCVCLLSMRAINERCCGHCCARAIYSWECFDSASRIIVSSC